MSDPQPIRRRPETITVQELVEQSYRVSDEHGFHDDAHDGTEYDSLKLMLIVGEVSEAHEELRDGRKPDEIYFKCKTCGTEFSWDQYFSAVPEYIPDLPHTLKGLPRRCDKPDLKPEGVPIETADAVIRAADYAGIREFDLSQAIYIKNIYNESRPHMHGKKM